jgi:hypothetical protein
MFFNECFGGFGIPLFCQFGLSKGIDSGNKVLQVGGQGREGKDR